MVAWLWYEQYYLRNDRHWKKRMLNWALNMQSNQITWKRDYFDVTKVQEWPALSCYKFDIFAKGLHLPKKKIYQHFAMTNWYLILHSRNESNVYQFCSMHDAISLHLQRKKKTQITIVNWFNLKMTNTNSERQQQNSNRTIVKYYSDTLVVELSMWAWIWMQEQMRLYCSILSYDSCY